MDDKDFPSQFYGIPKHMRDFVSSLSLTLINK